MGDFIKNIFVKLKQKLKGGLIGGIFSKILDGGKKKEEKSKSADESVLVKDNKQLLTNSKNAILNNQKSKGDPIVQATATSNNEIIQSTIRSDTDEEQKRHEDMKAFMLGDFAKAIGKSVATNLPRNQLAQQSTEATPF